MESITEQDWKSLEITLALTILSVFSLFVILLVTLLLLLRRYYRHMKRFNRHYGYSQEKPHFTQPSSPDSFEKRYGDTISVDLDTLEHRPSAPVNSQKRYSTLMPV